MLKPKTKPEPVPLSQEETELQKLQTRLATGARASVSKGEMRALTQRTYSNLPEV